MQACRRALATHAHAHAHAHAHTYAHAHAHARGILRFDDAFAERVRAEFGREQEAQAVRLQTFPRLAGIIKGFRAGELTVFTGPTGSGKTTVLAQMSLDYCFQGVRTLWGSFEVRHTRLARVMVQQVAAQSLCAGGALDEDAFRTAQRVLQRSPLFFMDCFGPTPLDAVLDTLQRSVAEQGIQHVVLDNLQFMLSGQHSAGADRFDATDRAVAALRAFASTTAVHVTLVVHPRKEPDDTPLGLASVSGTAKATQEADNVLILQKVGDCRYIDVRKNRWDGAVGAVPICFRPEARLVAEAAGHVARPAPPTGTKYPEQ